MQNKPSQITSILLTGGCFLAFFLFGFTDNLKGPTLPAMLAELGAGYGTGGNIFFGEYVGFLIATLLTGILADKFGLKLVLLLAGSLLALGIGGYSTFNNALFLAGSLFVLGLGLGAFELGPNAVIVSIHPQRKGLFLNLMAVMHGLGSTLAPLFAGWLLGAGHPWREAYRWGLLLTLIFILLTFFLRFPKTEESEKLDFRQITKIAFKGNLPWFYAAIGLYVAAEIGVASWLVVFLQEQRDISVTTSSLALAYFFAALMIGRLIGGFIVQRLGYLKSIFIASLGALACLILGMFTTYSFFLPLTGLFFSITFPTLTAAVSDNHKENINTLLGVLFTFAGLGGVIGPWLVAWGSDIFGLVPGFSFNILLTILLSVAVLILLNRRADGRHT